MASWHDKGKMVNFIRYAFSTSDDTAVCASVLAEPTVVSKAGSHLPIKEDQPEMIIPESPNVCISISSNRGAHRRRSNTFKRLELMKQSRKLLMQTRIYRWREPPTTSSGADAFPIKSVPKIADRNLKSVASQMLLKDRAHQENPFKQYLRVDESFSNQPSTKAVQIFLPMIDDPNARCHPLAIKVNKHSRVFELIGLICYYYTAKKFRPQLKHSLSQYALYVAEESGEIEYGLPPRSPLETVGNFHFPYMAMAQRRDADEAPARKKCWPIAVHFDNGDCVKLSVDQLSISLRQIRDMAVEQYFQRNSVEPFKRLEYKMEKLSEPGVQLCLKLSIGQIGCQDFFCLRQHSSRPLPITSLAKNEVTRPSVISFDDVFASESTFNVQMTRKGLFKCHAELHVTPLVLSLMPKLAHDDDKSSANGWIVSMARLAGWSSSLSRPIAIPCRQVIGVSSQPAHQGYNAVRVHYASGERQRLMRFRVSAGDFQSFLNALSRHSISNFESPSKWSSWRRAWARVAANSPFTQPSHSHAKRA